MSTSWRLSLWTSKHSWRAAWGASLCLAFFYVMMINTKRYTGSSEDGGSGLRGALVSVACVCNGEYRLINSFID